MPLMLQNLLTVASLCWLVSHTDGYSWVYWNILSSHRNRIEYNMRCCCWCWWRWCNGAMETHQHPAMTGRVAIAKCEWSVPVCVCLRGRNGQSTYKRKSEVEERGGLHQMMKTWLCHKIIYYIAILYEMLKRQYIPFAPILHVYSS